MTRLQRVTGVGRDDHGHPRETLACGHFGHFAILNRPVGIRRLCRTCEPETQAPTMAPPPRLTEIQEKFAAEWRYERLPTEEQSDTAWLLAEVERTRLLLARFLSHHETTECNHAISACVDLEGQAREVLGQ